MRLLTWIAAAAALVGVSLAPAIAGVQHVSGPSLQRGPVPQTLSRAQVKSWHASVLPKLVERQGLRYAQTHRVVLPAKSKGGLSEWLTDDAGYIWGLDKKGNVVTYLTDCSGAEGGVVDHQGRLVVACTNTSTVNIYNAGNTTGPADTVLSDTTGFYPAAAFEDTKGNIYASNLYGFACTTYSCFSYPGTIVWWTTANQSSGAAPSGTYTDPNLSEDYFADVDKDGNVYVDGFNNSFIPEVDMISNIMKKKPTATNLNISLQFPGGVYVVSPKSSSPMLSVIDQGTYGSGTDELYIYSLPYNGTLVYTDKPPQNLNNTCDPVAGGYDKKEAHIKIGDAGCRAADVGTIATNQWYNILNVNFTTPIEGLFVKSDK